MATELSAVSLFIQGFYCYFNKVNMHKNIVLDIHICICIKFIIMCSTSLAYGSMEYKRTVSNSNSNLTDFFVIISVL
jgi:hypothetical protein